MKIWILSAVLMALGFLYYYLPNVVVKICVFLRKYFFNEKVVSLYGKKIGLILFLLGSVFLLTGICKRCIYSNKSYLATKEFYSRNFKVSEKLCLEILSTQPKNAAILELLGKIYFITGRTELARKVLLQVAEYNPSKKEKIEVFLSNMSKKDGPKDKK